MGCLLAKMFPSLSLKDSSLMKFYCLIKILLMIILFSSGCTLTAVKGPNPSSDLRHEMDEAQLLTEPEFMNRVRQSASIINEGLLRIEQAVTGYAADNGGSLPSGNLDEIKSLLLNGGYLERWPTIPPFAFTDPVEYGYMVSRKYEDLDGKGRHDSVVYIQDLKLEVCEEFGRRYASPGLTNPVHQYISSQQRAPGAIYGRHITKYAILWDEILFPEYCDILWVMQYND